MMIIIIINNIISQSTSILGNDNDKDSQDIGDEIIDFFTIMYEYVLICIFKFDTSYSSGK